jgi:hypothetical protein
LEIETIGREIESLLGTHRVVFKEKIPHHTLTRFDPTTHPIVSLDHAARETALIYKLHNIQD